MANLYGVANGPLTFGFQSTIGSTNVSCPSGSETNVIQRTMSQPDVSGFWYPVCFGVIALLLGATPPTQVILAIRIGAGSDVSSVTPSAALLVANATLYLPLVLMGVASNSVWRGAGATLNITVAPTAQAVTCLFGGAYAYIGLWRAIDQ